MDTTDDDDDDDMTIMIMSVLSRSELLCLQSVLSFAFPLIQ